MTAEPLAALNWRPEVAWPLHPDGERYPVAFGPLPEGTRYRLDGDDKERVADDVCGQKDFLLYIIVAWPDGSTPVAPETEIDTLRRQVIDLSDQLQMQAAYHKAYRPEVVAEIAVQLSEEADWQQIAAWCGGRLRHSSDPSGEWSAYIDIPADRSATGRAECACQGMWITLGHDGKFRCRAEIDQPTPTAPDTVTVPRAEFEALEKARTAAFWRTDKQWAIHLIAAALRLLEAHEEIPNDR